MRTPIVSGGTHGRGGFARETVDAYMAQLGVMDPDALAKKVLPRLARNEGLVIEPRSLGRLVWVTRVLPGLGERMIARDATALLARELPSSGAGPEQKRS